MTIEEWIAQWPGLHRNSRELWAAIRLEFEQQRPPVTVRQMFYRMSTGGHVEKTEGGYRRVQRCLLEMRRAGAIPYDWIADNTRWVRKPRTYTSLEQAAAYWAANYRRAIWAEQEAHVEIWLEKDALAGVIIDVTDRWDVPLYVTRGYSSETFVYSAAEYLRGLNKAIYVYHFGDYDPSGRDMARDVREKLTAFGVNFTFIEAAVTAEQVARLRLPTRPTKVTDTRARNWGGGDSVELDAIPPNELRQMVESCITRHIEAGLYERTIDIEAAERAAVRELVQHMA